MNKENVYIFGNSPKCNKNFNISDGNIIVVLGNGIKYINNRKIDFWFTRIGKFSQEFIKFSKKTFIVSPKKYRIGVEENVIWLDEIDMEKYLKPFSLEIYPSLGVLAILYFIYFKELYNNIYISGFTIDMRDENIDYGYFWDKKHRLDNKVHNMWKEILFLKRILKNGLIYQF